MAQQQHQQQQQRPNWLLQEHVQMQPYRGIGAAGRRVGGLPDQHDKVMAAEVAKLAMSPQSKFDDLRDPAREYKAPRVTKSVAAPGYTGDNPLAEVHCKKHLPKVRVGRSEEELRRIWHEDERKADAQKAMMNAGPNFVEKISETPHTPLSGPQHTHHKGVKNFHDQLTANEEVEPAGFKGMGGKSRMEKMHGRRAPTQADFAMPPQPDHKRTHGVRVGSKPKDTLVLG